MDDRREPIRLLVLGASLRSGSLNTQLAELAASMVEAKGSEADLASMHEFDVPSYNGDVQDAEGFPPDAEELRRRLEVLLQAALASASIFPRERGTGLRSWARRSS